MFLNLSIQVFETKMCQFYFILLIFLLALNSLCFVCAKDVFHVKSRITFYPDKSADYFGYSVLLSNMGLHVGAPKAKSRMGDDISPGEVFACPLIDLDTSNGTCYPVERGPKNLMNRDFFKDDMWFGAQIATTGDKRLLVCAPRVITLYSGSHHLARGACAVLGNGMSRALHPLDDRDRVAYRTDGERKEYGEYGVHLNYFAYGQSGFSMTFTKDNHLLLGAPGVMSWAGSVVNYKYTPRVGRMEQKVTANPYYTKELLPDDYFGYSVDSGVFNENGTVLYVAGAPRSAEGYGQVLIFEPNTYENYRMNIKAKLIGPQLGGYFGATLCVMDINSDGFSDLLVGAPNYATTLDGELTYDQGAVFVYITSVIQSSFALIKQEKPLGGSGSSGARYGTAIADLGDIDGDGYRDVAIGAPWENEGSGVVYIHQGHRMGIKRNYMQRITAEGATSFGISISKGYDIDRNECNDIAIGAFNSSTVYVYRSIPTIQVTSEIKVPDAKSLKQDAENFTALFCISAAPNKLWPDVKILLSGVITIDPERLRAYSLGDSKFTTTVTPGMDTCHERIIQVNNQSDLSNPIQLLFELTEKDDLDAMTTFPYKSARLSETSVMFSSYYMQLLSDCGDDLICNPWLEMTLEPLGNATSYVPGIASKLGVKITVTNVAEPAYSVKLHVHLPCPPKRLDSSCSLQDSDMICDLPAPLKRNKSATWEVELEYSWDGVASGLMIQSKLDDPLYSREITSGAKELVLEITPYSEYNYTGKTETNSTVVITRETFDKKGDVLFTHYYEITNSGPSDLYNLTIELNLAEEVYLGSLIEGATLKNSTLTFSPFLLKANATTAYRLPLRFNLTKYSSLLEDNNAWNVTTAMFIYVQNGIRKENSTIGVTTTLILEPATPIWPLIVAVVTGLLVLAAIILALYKFGFFSRQKKEDLKQLLESKSLQEDPSSSLNQLSSDNENSNYGLVESDGEI